jgi:gamma-glutamyltranspeptidase/glutathione hydrolase
MSPTFVFQKDKPDAVQLVVGSPGGSTIPTSVVQVVNHVIDSKLDLAVALAVGKVHHQLQPETVRITKTSLEPRTQAALEAMGHTFKKTDHWGNVQAVAVDPESGLKSAASDPYEEGLALGQE